MKLNRYVVFLMFCIGLSGLLLTGPNEVLCSTSKKAAVLLDGANRCRKSLYASTQKKKFRHHWKKCIRRYEKIYTRYPGSDQAAWALYYMAAYMQVFTAIPEEQKTWIKPLGFTDGCPTNIKSIVWPMMHSIRSEKYIMRL